jgi:hypothetical protein
VGIFFTKEYNMKKIVRLTESDLTHIVKRVIQEGEYDDLIDQSQIDFIKNYKPFHNFLIPNIFIII